MTQLVSAFPHFLGAVENAVHGALRAQVDALVEEPGMNLGRSLVEEALAVEGVEDPLPLGGREPLGRYAPRAWQSPRAGLLAAVKGGPRYCEDLAGRFTANLCRQRGN